MRGRPGVRTLDWISDSYNFVGFSVNSASPPTFQSFFNGSPSHAGKPIYRLNVTSGLWELVGNPGITTMRSGEAFWIRCDGRSTYSGPVQLTVPGGPTLDYGRQLTEQALHFKNLGTNSRTLTLRVLTPGAAPAGSWAAVAGQIPFSYFRMNLASNEYGWFPLPPQLSSPVLPSGGEWMVRLEARRRDMVPWAGTIGPAGATYQALLEVQDGLGWCQLIAVTADGLVRYESAATLARNGSASRSRFRAAAANSPLSPYAGLWIGHAVIRKVSQPSHLTQPEVPLLVASPLQYRLLLHVDAQGEARLLQRVLQMWKNGTLKPDPANPSVQIVDEPGRFVLVTDERLVPNFSGATLRDGVPVGRRLSTVAYALAEPLALTRQGSFGDVNSIVAGSMSLDYDHPLNPFKHRYHPDHDNLDEGFRQKLAEGQESFTIGRDLSLQFTAADPDNLSLAGWGDNQLGGVYRETLRGVHKRPIYLEGTFRLYQAVRVSELNDGL